MNGVVLRLIAYLLVLAIGACFVMFIWTRNRRWLVFGGQIFKYALILILIVLALLALERWILAV